MFEDIIVSVCTALIVGAITFILTKAGKWINVIVAKHKLDIDAAEVDRIMASFKSTLTQAIIATNQTYVNEKKANGEFDNDAMIAAMEKTTEYCLKMLASDVLDYLETNYNDVEELISATAEAIIGASKGNTAIDSEVVIGTIVDYLAKLPNDKHYTMEEIVANIRSKFDIPK